MKTKNRLSLVLIFFTAGILLSFFAQVVFAALVWISPTGHYDGHEEELEDQWGYPPGAYDGDLSTYSQIGGLFIKSPLWSNYLHLTHRVLSCNKIRFYSTKCTEPDIDIIEIDVVYKDGSWENVYKDDCPSINTWIEREFTQGSVTEARIRLHTPGDPDGSPRFYLNEFEFYGEAQITAPTVTNNGLASGITPASARLNGEVTDTGGENPTVYIYWGDNDGGTNPDNWYHHENLGTKGATTFYKDVSNLSTGTVYYYRCYASNSAGSDWADSAASFTAGMDWISPTGYNDPSGKWNLNDRFKPEYAYDDNTSTYARHDYTESWSRYLELLHSPINCSKIRFYAYYGYESRAYHYEADVGVYYDSAWHDFHLETYADRDWEEVPLGTTASVTKARIKFNPDAGMYRRYPSLYEFDFYGEVTLTTTSTTTTSTTTTSTTTTSTTTTSTTTIPDETTTSTTTIPDETTTSTTTTIPNLPPPCGSYGDLNDDGYVTNDDITVLERCILGMCTPEQISIADVNNDGEVNMADVTQVERYILGIDDTFPVCDTTIPVEECAGTDTSCGVYPNCVNCNEYDDCSDEIIGYYDDYKCSDNECVLNSSECEEDCCDEYYDNASAYCYEGVCYPPIPPPPEPKYLTIELFAGWNLISSPVEEMSLSDIEDDCSLGEYKGHKVWSWVDGEWEYPTDLESERGYYVYSYEECTATVEGAEAVFHSLDMQKGWNMISGNGNSLDDIIGSCENNIIKYNGYELWRWTPEDWVHPNTSDPLEADNGYFVYSDETCKLELST